jgi:hypothetical protein
MTLQTAGFKREERYSLRSGLRFGFALSFLINLPEFAVKVLLQRQL